jgi:hypothetical protein
MQRTRGNPSIIPPTSSLQKYKINDAGNIEEP